MRIAEAYVEVRADTRKAEAEVRQSAKRAGDSFASIFAAAAFGVGLKKAIDAGSRLEQSVGATVAIFGKSSKAIDDWARGAAKAMGLSEAAARESLSLIGAQLKNFGFDLEDAKERGMDLVELGADLAATFGGTTADAVNALSAALRGEMDTIERYGVSLNDARLKAKALELGLYDGKGPLEANAKAMSVLALITEQTSSAAGQFARELDTVAGKTAVAAAEAENSAASLGQTLAPVYERMVELVGFLARAFGSLPAPLQTAAVALAAVVALAGPLGKLRDVAGSVNTRFAEMGTKGKLATVAMGGLAVALVAYSIAQKRAADNTQRATDAIEALSTATDAEAVNKYLEAIAQLGAEALAAGAPIEDVYDKIAEGNIEGAKRVYELLEASGKYESHLGPLAAAIDRAEAAQSQLATTNELYGDTTGDAVGPTADLATELSNARKNARDAASEIGGLELAFRGLLGILDREDALRGIQTGFDDLQQAAEDAWFAAAEANTKSQEAIEASKTGADNAAEAYLAAEAAADDAEAAAIAYKQQQDDLTREIIRYADEIGGIPADALTDVIAMIDNGSIVTAEAALKALERKRNVMFSAVLNPATDKIQVGKAGQVYMSAMGRYVNSPMLTTVGEGGRPEAILPLTNQDRMQELLGDPRIGGPVAAAMGAGGSSGGTTTINLVINDRVVQSLTVRQKELQRGQR